MEEILHIVKNITVFIVIFSIVSNLFARSKYHKYFGFIEGVIVLILVLEPFFSLVSDGTVLDEYLQKNILEIEKGEYEDELRMVGEQREQILGEAWQEGQEDRQDE